MKHKTALAALTLLTLLTACTGDDINSRTYRPYGHAATHTGTMIQSMVFVPDHADGAIALTSGQPATVTYNVRPASQAPAIASNFNTWLTFVGSQVQTRTETANLTITGVTADDDGNLSITAAHSGFAGGSHYCFALELNNSTAHYRTAYTPVYLTVPVEGITIAAPALQCDGVLNVGRAVLLVAVITPSYATDQHVTWSVDNPAIATISADGLLVATHDGLVTVTATAANGMAASLTVIITCGDIHISSDGLSQTLAE